MSVCPDVARSVRLNWCGDVVYTLYMHIIRKTQRDWVTPQSIFKAITLTCLLYIFGFRSTASTLSAASISVVFGIVVVACNLTSFAFTLWRLYECQLYFSVCAQLCLVYLRTFGSSSYLGHVRWAYIYLFYVRLRACTCVGVWMKRKKPFNHSDKVKNWRWKERTKRKTGEKQEMT